MNVNNISSKNLDQITGEITEDLSEKENKEDSQVRVEYDDIWTIEYGKWNKAVRKK